MSWGEALGHGMLAGYGVWDRDRQVNEEDERERKRDELRASIQRDLENLGASNQRALQTQRQDFDTSMYNRQRSDARDDAGVAAMQDAARQHEDRQAWESFFGRLPPEEQQRLGRERAYGQFKLKPPPDPKAAAADLESIENEAYRRSRGTARGRESVPPRRESVAEDPEFPQRLQGYLSGLRRQHPRFEDALGAFLDAMENAPDERFSYQKATRYLKELYGQPVGRGGAPRQMSAADRALALANGAEEAVPEDEPAEVPEDDERPDDQPPTREDIVEGARVVLKDGQRVRITKVYPNGDFDYK